MLLLLLQLFTSLILIIMILIQSQGSSLGRSFGGSTTYHSRRGAERSLFIATIIMAVVFVALSLLNIIASV
ncbi:preprotein translocase subunit SecG [Candidatus Collierbacteria bacterium]|nr:preprotein translocase subunit SecG [Candidatus Collierbacteria bacterium]